MPLSERDMNARLATHRFVEHFIDAVTETADHIALQAGQPDQADPLDSSGTGSNGRLVLDAMRWKVGATVALTSSGFETSPRDALVDSWVYCAQMTGFFRDGAGQRWFGSQHALVLAKSLELEEQIAGLARRFAPVEQASRWQEFVEAYASRTPLPDMMTPRRSSVGAFYEFMDIDEFEAVETVGSLGQVLDDFSSQVSMLGEQLPRETAWRTHIFLHEQGVAGGSLHEDLELMGSRLERVAAIADRAPVLVEDSLVLLQDEVATLIAALGAERVAVMESLGRERVAAMGAFGREREIIVEAISQERVATLAELERYVDKLVEDVFAEINGLATIVLVGLIALVLVVFGVPFGIGVLVGRVGKRSE
jgi:hypothetical protein